MLPQCFADIFGLGTFDNLWSEGWFMMLVWIVHTFLWAIVSICAYSLVMRVTWAEVGGTQFTAYMSMMNLSAIMGYQLAPIFAERYNYQTIFYLRPCSRPSWCWLRCSLIPRRLTGRSTPQHRMFSCLQSHLDFPFFLKRPTCPRWKYSQQIPFLCRAGEHLLACVC